jgi:hypothetical protein
MLRSSLDDRESIDEEAAIPYHSEEKSALPERQECNKDTSHSLPLSGQASTPNQDNMEVRRRNMMYTCMPNWPLPGPRIDALGVLGHSKSVSPPSEAIAGLGYSEHTLLSLYNDRLTPNCLIEVMWCADRGRIQSR